MPQYKHKAGPINICQKPGHELKAMTLSPELPNNMPIHDEKTSVQGDGIKFQSKAHLNIQIRKWRGRHSFIKVAVEKNLCMAKNKQIVMFHDTSIQKWHVVDPTLAVDHPSIN